MATPPESPVEEVVYELETTRVPKPIPVALEDLCRQTKFTRQEIRVMYRGFKTVRFHLSSCLITLNSKSIEHTFSLDFRVCIHILFIFMLLLLLRSSFRLKLFGYSSYITHLPVSLSHREIVEESRRYTFILYFLVVTTYSLLLLLLFRFI